MLDILALCAVAEIEVNDQQNHRVPKKRLPDASVPGSPWSMVVAVLHGLHDSTMEPWVICGQLGMLLFRDRSGTNVIFNYIRKHNLMTHVRNLTSAYRAGLTEDQFSEVLNRNSDFREACGQPLTHHVALISQSLAFQLARALGVQTRVAHALETAKIVGTLSDQTTRDKFSYVDTPLNPIPRPTFPLARR
jgi:hypothetical protein